MNNYYETIQTKSRAGVKYTKLVKRQSPLLQKSAKGHYFKIVVDPNGMQYAVIVHRKGELQPHVGMRKPLHRTGKRKIAV